MSLPGLPPLLKHIQYHPPRAARRHLHAVEPAALAPIGNGIHRHIEQRRCCLRTITAIATLSRWAGDGSQWAPTLDPIGIAQPLDHPGRKRTALPTAVACVVETCGNLDVNVRAGEVPDPLEHFRRRTADHIHRL